MTQMALTYDDIQLIPSYSSIESRKTVKTETQFTRNFMIDMPVVAAPMDTVCEYDMAYLMWRLGGVGVIHRFQTIDAQVSMVKHLYSSIVMETLKLGVDIPLHKFQTPVIAAAIGVGEDQLQRAEQLIRVGANVLVIDVAHGHHQNVKKMLESLKQLRTSLNVKVDFVAGNIATETAAIDLICWGADALRVGIGGGSACETRIRTGIGVPQVTSIIQCRQGVNFIKNSISDTSTSIPIIADGGIRYPGDLAKAIAVGASTIMIGGLLAGTTEAPGKIITTGEWPNIKKYKTFRGSASKTIKEEQSPETSFVEGISTLVPLKGSATTIINDFIEGLQSAASYIGVDSIQTLYNTPYVTITPSGVREARPHSLLG